MEKVGTTIGTKFSPPYNILFMTELEEAIFNLKRIYSGSLLMINLYFGSMKKFISKIHLTIKFTVEWSKTLITITISTAEGIIEADLHFQPTDSHQYLLSYSCHPFYCKKGIPYSHPLRLNRVFSNNKFFDERYNNIEKYLLHRGYKQRMVRKEVLRARVIPRDTLLGKVNN